MGVPMNFWIVGSRTLHHLLPPTEERDDPRDAAVHTVYYGIIKGGWFKGGGYKGALENLREA